MDLRGFDLNLLVVLHILLKERSVSKTAERLQLSQPAVSAALNRLRTALKDPILVRDGLQMVPTPRAEQLVEPVQAIVSAIEQTLADPQPFDYSSISRTFRIATNDYGAFVLVPFLMNRMQKIAPHLTFEIWDIALDVETALREGEIDLVIADAWTLRNCKCRKTLFSETFTCLVRQNHPRVDTQLTMDDYLQEKHALVSARGRVTGNVDIALSQQNKQRQVQITLPHILAIPAMMAATDMIVTVATRIANRFAVDYHLQTFPPPITLGGFDIAMAWPHRMDNDTAIRWLCDEIAAIGVGL